MRVHKPLIVLLVFLLGVGSVAGSSRAAAQQPPPDGAIADYEDAIDTAIALNARGEYVECHARVRAVIDRWAAYVTPRLALAHAINCALSARLGPALDDLVRSAIQQHGSIEALLQNPAVREDLGSGFGQRVRPFASPGAALACVSLLATPQDLPLRVETAEGGGPPNAISQNGMTACVFPGERIVVRVASESYVGAAVEARIQSSTAPGTVHVRGVERLVPPGTLPPAVDRATRAPLDAFTLAYGDGDFQVAQLAIPAVQSAFLAAAHRPPALVLLAMMHVLSRNTGEQEALQVAYAQGPPEAPAFGDVASQLARWGQILPTDVPSLGRVIAFAARSRCVAVTANTPVDARPAADDAPYVRSQDGRFCAVPEQVQQITLSAAQHRDTTIDWRGEAEVIAYLSPTSGDGIAPAHAFLTQLRETRHFAECAVLARDLRDWSVAELHLDCATRAGNARAILEILAGFAMVENPEDPDLWEVAGWPKNSQRWLVVENAKALLGSRYGGVVFADAVTLDCDVFVVGRRAYAEVGTRCTALGDATGASRMLTFGPPLAAGGYQSFDQRQLRERGGPSSPLVALTLGGAAGYDSVGGGLALGGELGLIIHSRRSPLGFRLLAGYTASGVGSKDDTDSAGEPTTSLTSELEYFTVVAGVSLGASRPRLPLVMRLDVLAGAFVWLPSTPTVVDVAVGGSFRVMYMGTMSRFAIAAEARVLASVQQSDVTAMFALSFAFGRLR